MICVSLSEQGFDPDSPSFLVTDLFDGTAYFTVTAVCDEDESAL